MPADLGLPKTTFNVVSLSVTEKRSPTYDLAAFKSSCSTVLKLNITFTAAQAALDLGFTQEDVVSVIQTMSRSQFYKSMTSNADSKVWQDVYHVPSGVGILYVKFTADAVSQFRLLSFKEK